MPSKGAYEGFQKHTPSRKHQIDASLKKWADNSVVTSQAYDSLFGHFKYVLIQLMDNSKRSWPRLYSIFHNIAEPHNGDNFHSSTSDSAYKSAASKIQNLVNLQV